MKYSNCEGSKTNTVLRWGRETGSRTQKAYGYDALNLAINYLQVVSRAPSNIINTYESPRGRDLQGSGFPRSGILRRKLESVPDPYKSLSDSCAPFVNEILEHDPGWTGWAY